MRSSLSRLLGLFLLATAAARGQNAPASVFDAIGTQVDKVFASAKPALALVRAQQESFRTAGTGFFIDGDGTLLTTASLLLPPQAPFPADKPAVTVETGGKVLPAAIVGVDPRTGVAVLKVAGSHPYLTLPVAADAAAVKPATPVVGAGFPFDLPAAPLFGMVTGCDSQCLGRFFATSHLRTTLAVAPGQLGGPVLDGKGNVLGMMVVSADERKTTYALPAAALGKVAEDLRLHGRVLHGWVGVGVDPGADGVRIAQIFTGTPAAASGLEPGDTVLKIDGRAMRHPCDVIDASFFSRVGEEMSVVVDRGGKTLTFAFPVGERPERMPVAVARGAQPAPGAPAVHVLKASAVAASQD
ncbi:MAG: S1C family serine protease [Verrucomicrobium sp.]|nr:S1C family serine protease [Verrucomicrobium sp.]